MIFRGTSRNFSPDMAKAAKITVAEVEEIVPAGELHPDEIHLPGIFVSRLIKGPSYEKRIEKLTVEKEYSKSGVTEVNKEDVSARDRIVLRAAKELKDGMYVNLGIGTYYFVTPLFTFEFALDE